MTFHYRIHGDEFAFLFKAKDQKEASEFMNRVVNQCAEEELTIYGKCFDPDVFTKHDYKQEIVKQKLKCTFIYSKAEFGGPYFEILKE